MRIRAPAKTKIRPVPAQKPPHLYYLARRTPQLLSLSLHTTTDDIPDTLTVL